MMPTHAAQDKLDRLLEMAARTDGRLDVIAPRVDAIASDVGDIKAQLAVVERDVEHMGGGPAARRARFPRVPAFVWKAVGHLLTAAGTALAMWAATHAGGPPGDVQAGGRAASASSRGTDTPTASTAP